MAAALPAKANPREKSCLTRWLGMVRSSSQIRLGRCFLHDCAEVSAGATPRLRLMTGCAVDLATRGTGTGMCTKGRPESGGASTISRRNTA